MEQRFLALCVLVILSNICVCCACYLSAKVALQNRADISYVAQQLKAPLVINNHEIREFKNICKSIK